MKNYDKLGVMLDCSRNGAATVEYVKEFIDVIAPMGYNALQLYMEDMLEVENWEYFGHMRGRYSKSELKEIDEYAVQKGVEIVPTIQTLAHMWRMFYWEQYGEINDIDGILLVDEPKTYDLIEGMVKTLSECLTSRRINISMDEARMVGMGKYRIKHGIQNQFEIICRHLNKILEICKKYGFEVMMFSDVFFSASQGAAMSHDYYAEDFEVNEEMKRLLPQDVSLIFWSYYINDQKRFERGIQNHLKFGNNVIYFGSVISFCGFVPNNEYSLKANALAAQSCLKYNIREIYVSLWGDNGQEYSRYSVLPNLYAYAQYMQGNFDIQKIKDGFFEMFKIPFDEFMYIDLPNKVREEEKVGWNNPHKYFLYSDPFIGITDCYVKEGFNQRYASHAEKLETLVDNIQFGYVFKTVAALCRVLEYKCELGVKTRKAYQAGDKATLRALAEHDYPLVAERMQIMYDRFRAQWERENKDIGFEVHDIRFGGMIHRVKACAKRLLGYVNGTVEKIGELEEKTLDFLGGLENFSENQTQIHGMGRIFSPGM